MRTALRLAAAFVAATVTLSLRSPAQAAAAPPRFSDSVVVFIPFTDESGFGGKWTLGEDVPRFLAAYVRERFAVKTVYPAMVKQLDELRGGATNPDNPASLAACAEHFGARYLVTGSVTDFSVGRFIAGDPSLGGYEAFSAEVRFTFDIYDGARLGRGADARPLAESEASAEVKDRSLGLTLLGKQSDRTNEYYALDNLYFGGKEFLKTIIGEAVLKSAEDFSSKLGLALPTLERFAPPQERAEPTAPPEDTTIALHRTVIKGEILNVDGGEVFVNIGSDDGVAEGQTIPVYGPGKELRDPSTGALLGTADAEVGEIQIVEVRGSHLSLAHIVKGGTAVKVHNRVRLTVVR